MSYRFGIFLIVIGVLCLVIFAVSFQNGETEPLFGVAGVFCLLIGIFLAIRYRPVAEPTTRFRTINKFRDIGDRQKKQ